jgi:hypothetical protein
MSIPTETTTKFKECHNFRSASSVTAFGRSDENEPHAIIRYNDKGGAGAPIFRILSPEFHIGVHRLDIISVRTNLGKNNMCEGVRNRPFTDTEFYGPRQSKERGLPVMSSVL